MVGIEKYYFPDSFISHPLRTLPVFTFISTGLLLPFIDRCITGRRCSTCISMSKFRHLNVFLLDRVVVCTILGVVGDFWVTLMECSIMRRNFVRNVFFVVASLLLIAVSLLAIRITVRADQNQRTLLSGHSVSFIQQAHLVQATSFNQQLNLSIGLKLRNSSDLDSLLSAIYNPNSSQYHQYLTPDQFNQLFSPTPDQVQQVVSYLQSQRMTVTSVAPNNLLIDATATVAQVTQAFNVQINTYQVGNHTFYANTGSPSVPTSISQLITSISGLDNSVTYHPLYRRLNKHNLIHSANLAAPSGFGPKDLSGAYNATPLQNAGILGDNQTVALFELDGYQLSDVQQYFQTYGLATPTISNVLVDNFNGASGQGVPIRLYTRAQIRLRD